MKEEGAETVPLKETPRIMVWQHPGRKELQGRSDQVCGH